MNIERFESETPFEWKLRLCLAKKRHELDMDWVEIRDKLGLDITPDQLRKQAVGYEEYDDYIKGYNGTATVILSVSDLHVPYQLPIDKLSDYAGRVDILQINGDIVDNFSCSKFPKMFRLSPIEEMIQGRDYLIKLIQYIMPKKVVINDGNHDIRLGAYLASKLDNEIQELMPSTSLDYLLEDGFVHYDRKSGTKTKYEPLTTVFDSLEIEYTHTWFSQIGDAIFAHPKAYSSAPLKTAEKAMYWFRNEGYDFRVLCMAHTHRIGQYKIGNTNIYEQGAFCKVDEMQYNDGLLINSQKEGCIVLCQDKDGNTLADRTKLIYLN